MQLKIAQKIHDLSFYCVELKNDYVLGFPKGPFRTKNRTALESVVFCYRRSFSLSVPFSCLFCLEKQAFLSPLRSVLLRPY